VTGATAGIDRAVAARLAEHGAEVVVHGRDARRFDRHLAINTRAPFQLVAALAPGMAARGHGAMGQVTARGRIGDPEEIADVVLFLVGERSSFVNGTVVGIHGSALAAYEGLLADYLRIWAPTIPTP
jgi:NAD(P)-dependent dehydrogenase (short-subunit alcohol dehydrogenase family)